MREAGPVDHAGSVPHDGVGAAAPGSRHPNGLPPVTPLPARARPRADVGRRRAQPQRVGEPAHGLARAGERHPAVAHRRRAASACRARPGRACQRGLEGHVDLEAGVGEAQRHVAGRDDEPEPASAARRAPARAAPTAHRRSRGAAPSSSRSGSMPPRIHHISTSGPARPAAAPRTPTARPTRPARRSAAAAPRRPPSGGSRRRRGLDEPVAFELVQPLGQQPRDMPGRPRASSLNRVAPDQQVADDQQRPPVPQHLERTGDRAVLAVARHAPMMDPATGADTELSGESARREPSRA